MSFIEVQFPTDISYGSSGGPEYATDVAMVESGYEQRQIYWAQARARYNAAHGIKTQSQLDELLAFFRVRKGRAYGFRFKDWMDYQANGQILGTGNGIKTTFQLVKSYSNGGISETRVIFKPVAGSIRIYLNSILQSTGFSIDFSTGALTFVVAPGSGVIISADFEFDVPVRFDTDRLSVRLEQYGVYSLLDIPLVEVRI